MEQKLFSNLLLLIKKGDSIESPFFIDLFNAFDVRLKYASTYRSNLKSLSVAGLTGALATLYPVRYIQSAIFFNLG